MSFLNNLTDSDRRRCFDLLIEVAQVRTHRDLFNWLHGSVQLFLPHDILLAAWGDFASGNIQHDIVSPLRDIRTDRSNASVLVPRVQELFERWVGGGRQPFLASADRLGSAFSPHLLHDPLRAATPPVHCMLVHGLRDQRGEQDSLYLVLSRYALAEKQSGAALDALLPHIDAAMRRVPGLPAGPRPGGATATAMRGATQGMALISVSRPAHLGLQPPDGMTEREAQIMQWVEMGKTNQEIGAILDISAYTVKNHLQRIFKKLDVYNRAQAVSRFKDSYHAHG